jgi:hypothetical protein
VAVATGPDDLPTLAACSPDLALPDLTRVGDLVAWAKSVAAAD